jgi:hypothetical protein
VLPPGKMPTGVVARMWLSKLFQFSLAKSFPQG